MDRTRRAFLEFAVVGSAAALGGWSIGRAKNRPPEPLRPPGAGSEPRFLAACIRCGQCVEACPPQILRMADVTAGAAVGTPFFVPREAPCDLCQGRQRMECIAVCPTGALAPTPRRDVCIGIAVVEPVTCLPFHGVACKACWHACPFPNEAIRLDDRARPVVIADRCVGCGLCEHACLTNRPSICVQPSRKASDSSAPRP